MISRFVSAACLLGLLPIPAIANETMTVAELVAHHRELTGKIVDVEGWIGRCQKLGCGMSATKGAQSNSRINEPHISIGEARDDLENQLVDAAFEYVVLRVKITSSCWSDSNEICMDRAPQVEPIRLVNVLRPAAHKPE